MASEYRVEYWRQVKGFVTVLAEDKHEAQILVELGQGVPGDESEEELVIESVKCTSDD